MVAVLFGPFGDLYRHDKRSPFVAEGYVDINPEDAKELGVEDGDYVWIDARPRGPAVPRLAEERSGLRVRPAAVPGPLLPRHAARRDADVVQHVRRHARLAGRAADARRTAWPRTRAPTTRRCSARGSHQSATRGWLKPTWMTDSLVRKTMFGQAIGKGFLPDVHCPTGAPREAIVKITRAEPGGLDGQGPVAAGGAGHPAAVTKRDAMKTIPRRRRFLDRRPPTTKEN